MESAAGLFSCAHRARLFPCAISGSTTQETAQEKPLALLRASPTPSRRQLAEQLKMSEDGIKHHLNKLKSSGIIRHVCPTKAGRWEILK
jgi:ATP-dependent DNA helicase RecG